MIFPKDGRNVNKQIMMGLMMQLEESFGNPEEESKLDFGGGCPARLARSSRDLKVA